MSQPASKITQLSAAKKKLKPAPNQLSSKLTQTQKTTQLCQARLAAYPHTTLNLWFCFAFLVSSCNQRCLLCSKPSCSTLQAFKCLSMCEVIATLLRTLLDYPCCFLLKFLHRGSVLKAVLCSEQKSLFSHQQLFG